MTAGFLEIVRGEAPLLVSIPHTGTEIDAGIAARLVSPWRAVKDTDWWVDRLYAFAADLGATVVRTRVSRTVIDVNRDPSGVSLYPGMATTELCPSTTFDGEALYEGGATVSPEEVARRRSRWFDPYHAALDAEVARLSAQHGRIVVYDCHSIRSRIPRLFDGDLPVFSIGTNGGRTAAPALVTELERVLGATGWPLVVDGRFKGGWITRRLGHPDKGIHAIQMELACRGYMDETPGPVAEGDWPPPYDPARAAPMIAALGTAFAACLAFARSGS